MGGLSVLRELRERLPHESLYYYGDGKNCPYGPKPAAEVVGYVDEGVQLLVGKGIKMLVVACNAATAAAIDFLRAKYDFPIVGLEPAVKPAVESTKTGVIGVLATRNTLDGNLFKNTSAKYSDKVTIIPMVGEGFVELVESDMEDTPEALEAVRRQVEPMISAGADKIVLGCTHYPFLAGTIRKVIGDKDIELVDSGPAVVRHVKRILDDSGLAAGEDNVPEYRFFTAGDEKYLRSVVAKSEICR